MHRLQSATADRRAEDRRRLVRPVPEPTSVLIADPQPLFREAVVRLIRQRADLQLAPVAEAEDGWTALELIRGQRPSVAIVARDLGDLDGLRVLNAVTRDGLPTRILLVGDTPAAAGYDAIAAGAAGWISRLSDPDAIAASVVAAATGRMALHPDMQSALTEHIRERSLLRSAVLSQRESDILRLLADGRPFPEVGTTLHISAGTVKSTLLGMYKRFAVGDRAAVVALALRRGWIE